MFKLQLKGEVAIVRKKSRTEVRRSKSGYFLLRLTFVLNDFVYMERVISMTVKGSDHFWRIGISLTMVIN